MEIGDAWPGFFYGQIGLPCEDSTRRPTFQCSMTHPNIFVHLCRLWLPLAPNESTLYFDIRYRVIVQTNPDNEPAWSQSRKTWLLAKKSFKFGFTVTKIQNNGLILGGKYIMADVSGGGIEGSEGHGPTFLEVPIPHILPRQNSPKQPIFLKMQKSTIPMRNRFGPHVEIASLPQTYYNILGVTVPRPQNVVRQPGVWQTDGDMQSGKEASMAGSREQLMRRSNRMMLIENIVFSRLRQRCTE